MAEKKIRRGSRGAIDGLRNFNRKQRSHRICTSVQSKQMENFKSDEAETQQKSSEARGSGLNKRLPGHRINYFRQSRESKQSVETPKCETRKPSTTTTCGRTSVRLTMPRFATPAKHYMTKWPSKSGMNSSTRTSSTQTGRWKRTKSMRRVAPTAYGFFVKAYFSEFRKKNPDEKIPFITLSRRCAEKWHSLPNPIRQEFYKMAERASKSFNRQKVTLARKPTQVHFPRYISKKPPTNRLRSFASTSKASKTITSKRLNKSARTNTQQNATTSCNKRSTKKSGVLFRPTKFRHNRNVSVQPPRRRN